MSENLLTAAADDNQTMANQLTNTNMKVPEKFLDKATGEVRTGVLLKSYLELEKKLSKSVDPTNIDKAQMYKMNGVPHDCDGYDIKCDHGMFENDMELNKMLHEKGFNNEQAQMVYDLAAKKLIPMVLEVAEEFQADREVERLVDYFGGQENFSETSRQLLAFGRKNFPPQVLKGMASSYDGVIALYKMMEDDDSIPFTKTKPGKSGNEQELRSMMKDPKYWRDRDPSFVKKVTQGFKDIYSS